MKVDSKALLMQMSLEEKIELLHGNGFWRTKGNHRLNIPEIIMTDGTHGVRYSIEQIDGSQHLDISSFAHIVKNDRQDAGNAVMFGGSRPATCFPNGSAVACCMNPALVYQMGQALGNECQDMGVGVLLGPGTNIRRTPLAGRGYEYYSEDPVLSADIATEIINGIQSCGVGACLKHFACNNSEYLRCSTDSIVEKRALFEIYLYAFERTIKKAAPMLVMSSYNLLNGERTSQSKWLLTDVLRKRWGFDGIVISDWYGVVDRVEAFLAGNDLEMPERFISKKQLHEAVQNGRVDMESIDASCLRMLKMLFRIKEGENRKIQVDYDQHHELAQNIAKESIVLLKNEGNILPLNRKKTTRVAVVGPGALVPVIQGSGCATTSPTRLDIPFDEIRNSAGGECEVLFAPGVDHDTVDNDALLRQAAELCHNCDVVVLFANTPLNQTGEDNDLLDLNICPSHEKLLHVVSEANPNVVVVVSNGDAIVMPWLENAKAVLETFYAGQGYGAAVASILFGETCPSGRLTVTVPNTLEETPAFLHYPGENERHVYGEGIYVGYRYYHKRKQKPLFPFGYGLSYTQFEYQNLKLSAHQIQKNSELEIQVEVTNTGHVTGQEVVQLYVQDMQSRLPRPLRELKGFCKLTLKPMETQTAHFVLHTRDFSYYDPALDEWIFEDGEFLIGIGKNADDILLSASMHAVTEKPSVGMLTVHSDVLTVMGNPYTRKELALWIDSMERQKKIEPQNPAQMEKQILSLTFVTFKVALEEAVGKSISTQDYHKLIDCINQNASEQ